MLLPRTESFLVPIGLAGFVGGILGNTCWVALGQTAIIQFMNRKLNRLRGIVEVPEDPDEPSALHPDKVARRREIADRWKQGRRLEDD